MQFGLFDHIDRSDRPPAVQYDERLQLVAAADAAGFYGYHLAEHHATPLSMTPLPGAFLAAAARVTQRIRLGPMVYVLPLSSPLHTIEEICMLDQLSHGRMEIGVGRGVSVYEMNYQHVDAQKSREIFIDAYECVLEGLTHDRLTYRGPYFTYDDVPMILRPLQRPHPAVWYGSSNAAGSTWAGERGLHFVTNGGVDRARENIDAFAQALARRGSGAAVPHAEFAGGTAIGITRHVVVAETDAEARRIAEPAHRHLHANQGFLRRESVRLGNVGEVAYPTADDFDAALAEGSTIAGTPEGVRAEIERQIDALGINYFIGYFMFGTMTLTDALRSLELFAGDVIPNVRTPR